MFDVTSDDISKLNDTDLRALIGRLCEAELASRGLSPASVTWGGHQTASDGGLDVRVALQPGTSIDGFIPHCSTGFQVKVPDMPRGDILEEMRPLGIIRPVIQDLANENGAYIIVSSHGSVADVALRNRRKAMRDALADADGAERLYTDFYDRTRIATWVRRHPGMITWVKEKIGDALTGWHPYGPWSGSADIDSPYLFDDKLRLHLGICRDAPAQPVADAIDALRDELRQPGKMVRLVGLSGVGKTRLVQALFDSRIGERPLDSSLAVYTNLSDSPSPQPIGLASNLIANRTRAVLIIDNCHPELHSGLANLCTTPGSTLSVITVEYDVRDDQPERTQVVTLDTSSPELIERLIRQRYLHLSYGDARKIAEVSGGNARIAIALAATVEQTDTIAGLSDDELFRRLFYQRHQADDALLQAAQACSLVYSFEGEALDANTAELPRLARLTGQEPLALFRHVSTLLRRDLVQQRGVWRAVLPHAIANRLATRALEDIPEDLIDQVLVTQGTVRLARSFSRRLSYLHDHPRAVAIVRRWLAPGGFLGNVSALDHDTRATFENIAPVSPEATLEALERIEGAEPETSAFVWRRHKSLLRSLAYDASLFDRCARILIATYTASSDDRDAKEVSDVFTSLFTIELSGTHASIEQRLRIIESLLKSNDPKQRSLGLAALDETLEATQFVGNHDYEFGARSRDYGFSPQSREEVAHWFGAALDLIERLAFSEYRLTDELRQLIARNFRGLWSHTPMFDVVERLSRKFAEQGFWREGWAACRQTLSLHKEELNPEVRSRLAALISHLGPSNLASRVRAFVLGDRSAGPDLEDPDDDINAQLERLELIAREVGEATVIDEAVFTELLPEILSKGIRGQSFGAGIAVASEDRRATWAKLVEGLGQISLEQRDIGVFIGYLNELSRIDPETAQDLLDDALIQPNLAKVLPWLFMAVPIDARGVGRLRQSLKQGLTPIGAYEYLAYGRATEGMIGRDLNEILLLIVNQPGGFEVAIAILDAHFNLDNHMQRDHEPELLDAGKELLRYIRFNKRNHRDDYHIARVARLCLTDPGAATLATDIMQRLRQAVAAHETNVRDNDELVKALFVAQPLATLDMFFEGDEDTRWMNGAMFSRSSSHRPNTTDEISTEMLISWCEKDANRRYPLAASVVTFSRRAEADGPLTWSDHAKALLAQAPEPRAVLGHFVDRFRPRSWSGSLAAMIEAKAHLLDELEGIVSAESMSAIAEIKNHLTVVIAAERKREFDQDRWRDERFE